MSRITSDAHEAFKVTLFERLNAYFEQNRISKKGDWEMTSKVIFALVWLVASYALLFLLPLSQGQFLALYIFQGLAQAFVFLNIAHDANHNAISKYRIVNKALSYVMDICGISSYMWRIMHNKGHHAVMNIHGEDEGIYAHGIFRFSPHAPWKPMHRFQHIYVFFMYAITSLDFLFVKDLEYLFFKNNMHVRDVKHPLIEWITIIGSKLFYLFYMIVLPVMVLDLSWGFVILAFLLSHFILGMISAWIIQVAHLLDINAFPESRHQLDFVDHIFATTTDYAVRSRVANFICGGLNHHVAHHLFPHVAHTHYPKLTRIIRETAAAYGVDYRENRSMLQAIEHHVRHLKALGRPPAAQLQYHIKY